MNDPWKITALDSASSSHIANIKISPKNPVREKLEGVHKLSEITGLHQPILWCSQLAMTTCRSLLEPWSHPGCTGPEVPPDRMEGAEGTRRLLTSAAPGHFPHCSPRAAHGSHGGKSSELLLNPPYVHFCFPGMLKERLLRDLQCRGTAHQAGVKHIPAQTKGTNGQTSQQHWLGHQRVSRSICGFAPGRLRACHILEICFLTVIKQCSSYTTYMYKNIKKIWHLERDAQSFVTAENKHLHE